jgi:hypothetical protein
VLDEVLPRLKRKLKQEQATQAVLSIAKLIASHRQEFHEQNAQSFAFVSFPGS